MPLARSVSRDSNSKFRVGHETGCGGAVLDPELWINVFEMFAHGCGADSQNRADLGVRFSSSELR